MNKKIDKLNNADKLDKLDKIDKLDKLEQVKQNTISWLEKYRPKSLSEYYIEKNQLNKKTTPSENDLNRIVQLDGEINNLMNYLNELNRKSNN